MIFHHISSIGRMYVKVLILEIVFSFLLLIYRQKSPDGFAALAATGDGNCMYNSVSILMFGSEGYAAHLRLLSAIHALDPFDHYLTTVNFLCTLITTHRSITILYFSYRIKFKTLTQHNSF